MYAVLLPEDADAALFRDRLKRVIAAGYTPRELAFVCGDTAPTLFEPAPLDDVAPAEFTVPRAFAELMQGAVCHRNRDRFDLLFALLWLIRNGQPHLASRASDPLVSQLRDYAKNVGRDIHKMHAFVRFREEVIDGETLFTAWFEPQHHILRAAAPFFVKRFAQMNWLIATPEGTIAWRDKELSFAPPGPKPKPGADGVLDELWLAYYRTTFNPARLRLKAMTAEMPKHYWATMPETALIPELVAAAGRRVETMRALPADAKPRFADKAAPRPRAAEMPATPIAALRAEAAGCRLCPLHAHATQTVFGEGPPDARLVFVGEQPGDGEDLAGRPFVGPAGQLLDQALKEAGIERGSAYLTNAVKHFKYEPRGKRRIHKKPNAGEVHACRWWLEREIAALKPALIVALGATAGGALSGHAVSVLRERGPAEFSGVAGFLTIHPSYLLRLPGEREKAEAFAAFVADLKAVSRILQQRLATAA